MTTAFAPGRVNLIGDHVDYLGGPVLPMAIHLGTTVTGERGGNDVVLTSEDLDGEVRFGVPVEDPGAVRPAWGRYVAGVAAQLGVGPGGGLHGRVGSTLPIGAGLSSSAALEVATALALGADPTDPVALAGLARAAEQAATGVPCGIMDQLASASGRAGHALLIDCHTLDVEAVPVPDDVTIWVLHSGEERTLAGSAYAERRAACEAAEAMIGPLRLADIAAVGDLEDPVLRARARHVVGECDRVRSFAAALARGDRAEAGRLMVESHRSLAGDFEVSTPALDALVVELLGRRGVHGARLTGAGFGGCVVALCDAGVDLGGLGRRAWAVRPAHGARILD